MPHVHFQTNIHQGQEVLTKEQQIYKYNTFIFDIYNNWININDLVNKVINKQIKKILPFDQEILQFIEVNKIDVLNLSQDQFFDKYYNKELEKEIKNN